MSYAILNLHSSFYKSLKWLFLLEAVVLESRTALQPLLAPAIFDPLFHWALSGCSMSRGLAAQVGELEWEGGGHSTPTQGFICTPIQCQGTLVRWPTKVSIEEFLPIMLIKWWLSLPLSP